VFFLCFLSAQCNGCCKSCSMLKLLKKFLNSLFADHITKFGAKRLSYSSKSSIYKLVPKWCGCHCLGKCVHSTSRLFWKILHKKWAKKVKFRKSGIGILGCFQKGRQRNGKFRLFIQKIRQEKKMKSHYLEIGAKKLFFRFFSALSSILPYDFSETKLVFGRTMQFLWSKIVKWNI